MKFKAAAAGPSLLAIMAAARSAEASGRLGDAQALCRQILSRQPHHADANLLLAKMAAGCGQDSLADRLLRGVIERHPDCVEAQVDLADLMRSQRNYDEAIYWSQRAIAKEPRDSHAHYVLGVSCIECWLIPEAIEALKTSVELNPGFWAAFDKLGEALSLDGRHEEAIQAFRKSTGKAFVAEWESDRSRRTLRRGGGFGR
jgi:tetratricopeptide (TPR) repeat protein